MGSVSERARRLVLACSSMKRPANAVAPLEAGGSLFQRFDEQSRLFPDRPAARGARHCFTYAALAALARLVGQAILREAPADGAPVALLLEHDALAAAAQLGVYAAGRVCVPLDPRQPHARTALVLAESRARVVLCDTPNHPAGRALAARAGRRVRCLCLEDESALPPGPGPFAPTPQRGPACVIFTSGSTGAPKGAVQSHGTLLHDVLDMVRLHRLGPGDRVAVLAPATAIAGTTALFGALLGGGAAHYFDVCGRGPAELAAWLAREEITFYQSVTTLFRRLLLGATDPARFERIRVVRLVGEAATRTEWRLWRERFPATGILETGLGSSEACMVSRWVADRATRWDGAVLPAGRPVPDKEVLVVDGAGASLPPGEPGEIVVRSEFVFDGYWRRPELTAEVLVKDPADPRRRFLRTGDLGRLLPDGTLLHLGRRDGQVKIGGNRVETAEVETALRDLPAVRDATVVALETATGGSRLVAFVTATADAPDVARRLRARLRERLPSFMVPDAVAALPELPLLPGGKVDREALAARAREGGLTGPGGAPPQSPVEETLAGIVEEILDATPVARDQNLFLELGADSLAAVQIVERISEVFGRRIPPEALAEGPTVAALGRRLDAAEGQERDHIRLHPQGDRTPLFAICGAFGSALRLLAIALRLDADQPFYGLQPPGMDWARARASTIESMAEHHLRELRRLAPRGPYRLLGTSLGGLFAFEIACRLRNLGEQVELLALVDTFPPDCVVDGRLSRSQRGDWTQGVPTESPLAAAGVRVARQHRAALDEFRLTRRFDGTILYFRCASPPVPEGEDRRLLWRHFAADLKVVDVPGVHGRFHLEPQLSAILEPLRAAL